MLKILICPKGQLTAKQNSCNELPQNYDGKFRHEILGLLPEIIESDWNCRHQTKIF